MPYIPFTDEQKQLANSVDLAEYLRVRGEKLERIGREHKLILVLSISLDTFYSNKNYAARKI